MADPGFPRGRGANSPGGVPTYDFAKFSQKLHEIERIWTPGGRILRAPLDPPLVSVCVFVCVCVCVSKDTTENDAT